MSGQQCGRGTAAMVPGQNTEERTASVQECPLRLYKRTTCGLWCPSNKLRLMLHFQDCSSPSLCCSFCLILFTRTWKVSLSVSFDVSEWLSTPELSGWSLACMSCFPFSSSYQGATAFRFISDLFLIYTLGCCLEPRINEVEAAEINCAV